MKLKTTNFTSLKEAQTFYQERLEEENEEEYNDVFSSSLHEHNDAEYNTVDVLETDTHIIIGCLKHDEDAQDFWDDDFAGELKLFTRSNYHDLQKQMAKSTKLFYLVDKYEHGNVHYSIASTKGYVDQQFDVSQGCGMYIPNDDIQKQYKKMKKDIGETEAFMHFIKGSNSVLDSYSDWCNGEVYGYSVVVYDKLGNVVNEENECWGYIGRDSAEQEKINIMQSLQNKYIVEQLSKEVIIENKSLSDVKNLPFKIDKSQLESFQYAYVYNTHVVVATYKNDEQDEVPKAIAYNFKDGDKKPSISKFEGWQMKHNVTPEQFLQARMKSDINAAISHHLTKNDVVDEKKNILSI